MILKKLKYISLLFIVNSCFTINYNFKGVSIPPEIQTVSVQYIVNRASQDPKSVVEPGLSNDMTNAIKDYIEKNTKLLLVNGLGDVDFESEITQYSTQSVGISSGDIATSNRFTISIKVKYTNSIDSKSSFEQTFTRYYDYPANESFQNAQNNYTEDIIKLLTEDIFNKAFVNW